MLVTLLMIIYRTATTSDLPALADIRWEHWSEDPHDPAIVDRDTFRHEFARVVGPLLASGQMTFWLAVNDGEIVANIVVERIVKVPKPSKLDDGFGYVTNVHTREAFRNQGIGSELLRHVQAWALEQDMEMLVLWPAERSVPFYKRAGFHNTDAVEFEVRPYIG